MAPKFVEKKKTLDELCDEFATGFTASLKKERAARKLRTFDSDAEDDDEDDDNNNNKNMNRNNSSSDVAKTNNKNNKKKEVNNLLETKENTDAEGESKVWKILRCINGHTHNRDVNASKNITFLLVKMVHAGSTSNYERGLLARNKEERETAVAAAAAAAENKKENKKEDDDKDVAENKFKTTKKSSDHYDMFGRPESN